MANGLQNEFKVYPVQMVTMVSKLSRESNRQSKRQPDAPKNGLFDTVLNNAIENKTKAPADCYTVTYNADSQLQTYYYRQSREYTF